MTKVDEIENVDDLICMYTAHMFTVGGTFTTDVLVQSVAGIKKTRH